MAKRHGPAQGSYDLRGFRSLHHKLDQVLVEIDNVKRGLRTLTRLEVIAMANLDALTAQVQANTDAEESAILLIRGLADQLAAAATDPAKVQEIVARMKTSADALAAAVVANTTTATP